MLPTLICSCYDLRTRKWKSRSFTWKLAEKQLDRTDVEVQLIYVMLAKIADFQVSVRKGGHFRTNVYCPFQL